MLGTLSKRACAPENSPAQPRDKLAMNLNVPLRSSDDPDEQASQLHSCGPALTGKDARQTTGQYVESHLLQVLGLSELPDGILGDRLGELDRQEASRAAGDDDVPPPPAEAPHLEDTRAGPNETLASGLDDSLQLAQRDDYSERCEDSGVLTELEEATNTLRNACNYLPETHPEKALCLSTLGISLQSRFKRLGDLGVLDEVITTQQHAVRLTPNGHPDKPGLLNNLGNSFQDRFERLGNLGDLDEAIAVQQQAVRLIADSHAHKPGCLHNLGNSYHSRFERFGQLSDLDKAVMVQRQALCLIPDGHPNKYGCLHNLGISFRCRFERSGDIRDLSEAITTQQYTVRLTPDSHTNKPAYLNSLGISFHTRFKRLDDIGDLDEAITIQQHAIRLTPYDHPDKPEFLNTLGISFQNRFQRLGDLGDLDEAITAQQQAVCLTPDDHPDKPAYLNNLGISLCRRFERLGDLGDLDKAITTQQQAARLTPDDHPNKPGCLNNLGISFQNRFERLNEPGDLDEAITAKQQAVRLTPDGYPHKPGLLSNLGNSFLRRFEHLDHLGDLDEAITTQQHAVRLAPNDHPRKPGFLNNLGNSLQSRFERLGDLNSLDGAITVQRHAIHLIPDGHPHKPGCLNNLGNSFRCRFERLGDPSDLDNAIAAQQQAIHLTPCGHPHRPGHLNSLGTSFITQLLRQPDNATHARAVSAFSQSANSSSGPPSVRFVAARYWATLCFSAESNETLDAYATLLGLLPRVVWLGRTVEQRYEDISSIGNAVADAVTAAIHFGELNLALEWVEQGRSIVWGQMLRLRASLDELRQHHPDEANVLETISHDLDATAVAYPDHSGSKDVASQSVEEMAQAHRRLAEEHDRTLARIRNLPGFADFLRPETSMSLCGVATSGPVVIVNAHKLRCDALILLPHSSQVSHVPLPGLQLSAVQDMQLQLVGLMRRGNIVQRPCGPYGEAHTELSDTLGWLWSYVVEPILCYLKLLTPPTPGEMPHITWCLTGPLTFLPIHAAGLYDTKDGPKLFNYAVSSYTPTLAALLSIKRRTPKPRHIVRLLAISQPATPGQNPLPGTTREADVIQMVQGQTDRLHVTRLDDQEATVSAVLQHMKECSWAHLACHGVQDSVKPTDSAFLLIDHPLTLREIMKQSFSHTELAFLSACQTAKGDSGLPEEAIHLAAGMLMTGYASVVGTMWSIQDSDAPLVAEKFYKYMMEKAGGDSTRAAYALHYAVAHLRGVAGEGKFARWAPFIHLGGCSPPLPA